MKKILSKSKMREALFVGRENGKLKKAIFMKGEVTELTETEYKFLVSQEGGPFNFLVEEGTFSVIDSPEKAEEVEKKPDKPLSKKQKKKLADAARKTEAKKAEETKTERQGK